MPQQILVVMRHGKWEVVRANVEDPASAHDRKDDAIRAARALAAQEGASLVVFGLDGKVQELPEREREQGPGQS